MISPGGFSIVLAVGAMLGVLGYTYHEGKQSSKNVCEAEQLREELKTQLQETLNLKELNEYSNLLIGEAQKSMEDERIKSVKLQETIDQLSNSDNECVPSGVLTELRKLRSPIKN